MEIVAFPFRWPLAIIYGKRTGSGKHQLNATSTRPTAPNTPPVRDTRRVLLRFTLSYALLLLVPIALSIGATLSTARMTEQQVLQSNRLVLSHALDMLERSVREAESFAQTLGALDDVAAVMRRTETASPETLFQINRASSRLPVFSDANNIVSGYCLYAPAGDFLMAPARAYLNLWRYYENSLRYEPYAYEAYREAVLDMRRTTGFLPSMRHIQLSRGWEESITLFFPYVSFTTGRQSTLVDGKVIYTLSTARLQALIAPALDFEGSVAYMYSRDGTLLMTQGLPDGAEYPGALPAPDARGRVVVNGREMVFSQEVGESTGLSIVVLTPASAVNSRVTTLTRTLLLVTLTLLAIGIGCVFFVARSNRRPLMQLIGHLPPADGAAVRSLWDVDRAVHRLSDQHSLLAAQISQQKGQMRTVLLHQLIDTGISDELEIETLLRHVDLDIQGNVFRGVYLQVLGSIELSEDTLIAADFTQEMVLRTLSRCAEGLVYLAMLDYGQYILLYSAPAPEAQERLLAPRIGDLSRSLRLEHGLSPLFFVGPECDTLSMLHKSFAEARHLMETSEREAGQYLFVAGASRPSKPGYAYTVRDEQQLIAWANKGKAAEIDRLLDQIYRLNFADHTPDVFVRQLLYHRMIGTMALSPDCPATPASLERVLSLPSPRAIFDALSALYHAWCDHAAERMEASQHQLIQDILAYVQENYADDGMGLAAMALHLGMTESYLSAFFREKVGRTFSAYLEMVRIQQANQLLMTTADTIDEIARQVGYTNADSFRRAYKRVHGYAPSQHRHGAL